jgi:hypothetical protein
MKCGEEGESIGFGLSDPEHFILPGFHGPEQSTCQLSNHQQAKSSIVNYYRG